MECGEFPRVDAWRQVLVSSSPRNLAYEGQSIADLAAQAQRPPLEWIYDALLETELHLDVVEFGMCEENRKLALRQPFMMLCTDGRGLVAEGPLCEGVPHPRNYGAFPRVLSHYVRKQGVISLEEAVRKMSGLPAEKLRWADRGLVKAGHWADLVVFDPDVVEDRATYEAPHQYPVGIDQVLVNGELVIHNGAHTGLRPGKPL
jgi:N-acyl-D-aspartate/D-glutamate deacylase